MNNKKFLGTCFAPKYSINLQIENCTKLIEIKRERGYLSKMFFYDSIRVISILFPGDNKIHNIG